MSKKKKKQDAEKQLEDAVKLFSTDDENPLIKKPLVGGDTVLSDADKPKVDLGQKFNVGNSPKHRMDKKSFEDFKGKNKQILKGNTKH